MEYLDKRHKWKLSTNTYTHVRILRNIIISRLNNTSSLSLCLELSMGELTVKNDKHSDYIYKISTPLQFNSFQTWCSCPTKFKDALKLDIQNQQNQFMTPLRRGSFHPTTIFSSHPLRYHSLLLAIHLTLSLISIYFSKGMSHWSNYIHYVCIYITHHYTPTMWLGYLNTRYIK